MLVIRLQVFLEELFYFYNTKFRISLMGKVFGLDFIPHSLEPNTPRSTNTVLKTF